MFENIVKISTTFKNRKLLINVKNKKQTLINQKLREHIQIQNPYILGYIGY